MTRSVLPSRHEIRRRQRRLDEIYPKPDELDSFEAWQRAEHRDLAVMDRAALRAEQVRLRLRLLYDAAPRSWFLARARAIEEALRHAR